MRRKKLKTKEIYECDECGKKASVVIHRYYVKESLKTGKLTILKNKTMTPGGLPHPGLDYFSLCNKCFKKWLKNADSAIIGLEK
jgi:ribosomal protein S14